MIRRLLILGALALVPLAVQPSSASFTASSTNAASTFTTAAEFNTVSVTLDPVGTPLKGTVALSATATSERGIAQVAFQHAPAGGSTWTDACVDTVEPYTCDWDTAGDDGMRDVRAVARDSAGYERVALRASRRIDNAPPALGFTHATAVHGTVTLTVNATDAGVGVGANGIVLEYRPTGGAWVEICKRSTSGTCAWATGGLADGAYDLRASAADALGNTAAPVVLANRHVDNSPPTSTLSAAPAPIEAGEVTMTVDASDTGGSGIQKVVFQGRQTGTSTWMTVCEVTDAPYVCSGNTAGFSVPGYGVVQVPDGEYDMRGVVYDHAGNTTALDPVPFRIDNTQPALSFTAPTLAGAVQLTPAVSDAGSGLASVTFEASHNDGMWTTLCTTTVAPHRCDWNVPPTGGTWDLRIVATDRAGNQRAVSVADVPGGTP